jgi:protein ImuB
MFAALHLPDLPVVAALRVSPSERGRPCGVVASLGQLDEGKVQVPLIAVSAEARSVGISSGWPLSRALVRCPDFRVLAREPDRERHLLAELIELAESLTPDLEISSPDTLLLDLSRTSSRRLEALHDFMLMEAVVVHARAMTPDLAHLAVRHEPTRGMMLTSAALAGLPLGGLRTLGDYLKIPRQDLTERLGSMAGHWHDLLHGKVLRLLRLHRPPESLKQSYDFEDPVQDLESVVFILKRLLHGLSSRLAARHVAASNLEISLRLERGKKLTKTVRLPEPLVAPEAMLHPLQTLLESLQAGAPIIGLDLDAETTLPSSAQREWFGRQLPQPERWAGTLAQLEALLGPGKVGIPVPPANHQPDAFTLRAPGSSGGASVHHPSCPVPLHRFRPPLPVSVAFESRQDQPLPLAILNGEYRGEITRARGPFPQSGQWWEPTTRWQRLEWDIQLVNHQLLRLVFVPPEHWQLDGRYA